MYFYNIRNILNKELKEWYFFDKLHHSHIET